jgi:hypothetical protein
MEQSRVPIRTVLYAYTVLPDPSLAVTWNRDGRPLEEKLVFVSPLFHSGNVEGRRRLKITIEDCPEEKGAKR